MRDLAERQLGLLARLHLAPLGLTRQQWYEAKHNRRWEVMSDRVLLARGAPKTDEVRALAAVLDASPGGALDGRSTLAWCGLRGFNLRTIHVSRPRELRDMPVTLGTLHRLRALHDSHVIVERGVPTQVPLRAIWSEAARYSAEPLVDIGLRRIGRLLDDAHTRGLVRWSALHKMVDDLQQRGRAGTVLMRTLAADRQPGSSPSESGNEDQFEQILKERFVPPLERQIEVGGLDLIGRCDYRDPGRPLVVEVNSMVHHTTPSDRRDDELRYLRLNDAGYFVAVIWDVDLWRRPRNVAAVVRDARRLATAGERRVLHSFGCPWPISLLGTPASSISDVDVPRTDLGGRSRG